MTANPQWQLDNFKLPPRFRDIDWPAMVKIPKDKLTQFKEQINRYPEEKEIIYLHGEGSGSGKTALAVCMAKELIRQGKIKRVAMFVPYNILMDRLRQDVGPMTDSPLFKDIQYAGLIILDDIGVEKLNRSVAERYYLLMDYLWSYKKPAIFTSKFSIADLTGRAYDDVDEQLLGSIISRMLGMCSEYKVPEVEDYRVHG